MKHLLLLAGTAVCLLAACGTYDTKTVDSDGIITADGTPFFPFQFSIRSNTARPLQLCSGNVEIPGVAIGLTKMQQKSAVISFAPANCLTKNYFIQTGLLKMTGDNYGLAPALVNFDGRNYFLEAGLVNITGDNHGLQTGVVNVSSPLTFCRWQGIQIGVVNFAYASLREKNIENSIEIKLDEKSKEQIEKIKNTSHFTLQIGLLNFNKHALLKWFPIINFSVNKPAPEVKQPSVPDTAADSQKEDKK